MSDLPDSLPATDLLLQHTEFLSALAARLVSGGSDADDLTQETWLSALRRPPADAGAVRAWLAKVARNHALQAHRSRRRRVSREQWVARPEGLPSTDEIVARENARRGVVEGLHQLSEPYRSTLLLRFYEDLPPREVARRMKVPVETARTRIKRGLALLREELDRRNGGDRSAWVSGLTPLALGELPAPALSAPSLVAPFAVPLGLLALVGAVLFWSTRVGDAPDAGAARPAPQLVEPGGAQSAAGGSQRTAAARGALGRSYTIRIVYDDDGAPVAGLEASVRPSDESFASQRWTSDPEGRAPTDVLLAPGDRISAPPSLWTRALEQTLDQAALAGAEVELRVQRASSVRGRVIDERSRPVAGALVWAALPKFAHLDDGEPRAPLARCISDAAGAFTLLELPEHVYVHAAHGERTVTRGAHVHSGAHRAHEGLELRLERSWVVSGRVVNDAGAPLAGVLIATATHDLRGPGRAASTADVTWRNLLRGAWTSDRDGRFEIRGLAPLAHNLTLSLEGHSPVERRITGPGWDEVVVLERAAQLALELRDTQGAPLEGEVSLLGETTLSTSNATVAGRALLWAPRAESAVLVRARASGFATRWEWVALDGRERVAQVLQLSAERRLPIRVVDGRGAPIAAATASVVALGLGAAQRRAAVAEETLSEFLGLGSALTDPDGRVEFGGLPHESLEVRVAAPGFAPAVLQAPAGAGEFAVTLEAVALDLPRLRLSARDRMSGAPVADCVVTARAVSSTGNLSRDVRFDAETELELPESGLWTLYARADGYAPTIRRWRAGDETQVELLLAPERELSVRVRDLRGAPVHPARLIITDEHGAALATAISSTYWANYIEMPQDGTLVVRGLPAARVHVGVHSAQLTGVEPILVDLTAPRDAQVLLEVPADLSSPRARVVLEWPKGFLSQAAPAPARGSRAPRGAGARLVIWDSSGALCGRHRIQMDDSGMPTLVHPWTMVSLRFDARGVCQAAGQQRIEADALTRDFGPRVSADGDSVSLLVPANGGRVAVQIGGEDVLSATFAPPLDGPVRLSFVGR